MHSHTYQSGIFVYEVILAIAIATGCMIIFTQMIFDAESVFARAYAKDHALDTGQTQPSPFSFSVCEPFIAYPRTIGSYVYQRYKDSAMSPKDTVVSDHVQITPITLPIAERNMITDVNIKNHIWYVSTDSSVYSDPDLFVFDVTRSDEPLMLTSLNTGPGISAIAVVDDTIYAAVASSQYQLQFFRIHNPASVDLASSHSLIPPYATATRPYATSIAVSRGYLYLGTEKWEGDELTVFARTDIDRPTDTSVQSLFSYDLESKVKNIYINNNMMFVSASAYEQLITFDIHDDTSPLKRLDSFSPRGWSRQEGIVSTMFEDTLFFGRTSGGFDVAQDHEGFLWSPLQDDLDDYTASINIPSGIYGAMIDHDFVYLSTGKTDHSLSVYDPHMSSSTRMRIDLPLGTRDMQCYLSDLYVRGDGVPIVYRISFI